ncbi:hypothetical protein N6H14_11235 [Paenibacillus sp. CC-CFT747]|nr:hypothetical protein N6H14_11235 [Paenibacillus sp. CC-CFT747]
MKYTNVFKLIPSAALLAGLFVPGLAGAANSMGSKVKVEPSQAVLYKKNSEAPKEKFITKETAIEKAHIKQEGKLISSTLMSWNHFSEEILGKSNSMPQIDDERMVWVVKVDYPKGIDTKGGYFNKAVQISAFDAETGQILNVTTIGDSPSKEHKRSRTQG